MSEVIVDTFSPEPAPPPDWEAMSEQELLWRAVAAEEEEAQAEWHRRHDGEPGRSARGNKYHDPKTGKFTTGPGGGGGGSVVTASEAVTTAADVRRVEEELGLDHNVEMPEAEIDALMSDLKDKPPMNLARLQVKGEPNCYQRHVRVIPRNEMPQLPENNEALAPFSKALASRGISAHMEDRDPRTLHMTQNELNSQNVATLYGYIHGGGWRKNTVIIADRDGDILDGHHRWAAASAARMAGDDFTVHVLLVDTDIDTLLAIGNEMSGEKKAMTANLAGRKRAAKRASEPVTFGEPTTPAPSETGPWLWIDGQWYLVATDTADGVPESLEFLHPPQE